MKNINIYEIYDNFVKINYTKEYLSRYDDLPLHLNNKKWKWDFPRIIALLEFRRFMEKYNFIFNDVLSFNGVNDPEYEYLAYKNIYNYNYDDDKVNYDLHNLKLDKNDFDFAMINQTIEHLYDPIRCIKNIYKHLKIGGIFYANVPVNSIRHSEPEYYYTGITPVGLGVMVKLAGFEILEIGQWGNRDYLDKLFNVGWVDYQQTNSYNDINCPIITWILARKID